MGVDSPLARQKTHHEIHRNVTISTNACKVTVLCVCSQLLSCLHREKTAHLAFFGGKAKQSKGMGYE
jgi:hypothetical protein